MFMSAMVGIFSYRLVEWNNESFTEWKYSYYCTNKNIFRIHLKTETSLK